MGIHRRPSLLALLFLIATALFISTKVSAQSEGYQLNRYEPTPAGDPFLSPKDLSRHTVGLRFDPMPWVGLKSEYHLTRHPGEDDIHSARFQAAFTF